MITSVDFPDPGEMWVRWVSFAAAFTAAGFDDTWTVTADGAHRDDGGGNWAHLALVEGGRAVLWGYDHEYSETCDTDPPLDLLAEAPEWLPWEELTRLQVSDQLGYVLWFDGGWRRAAYPDGVSDGLTSTAGSGLDDDAATAELNELVWEWGEHDDEDDRDEVSAAVARLLALAAQRKVGPDALTALVGRLVNCDLDLPAGLAVARRGGITPDGSVPIIAPGQRPDRRRIRALSQNAHDRLVWTAMRETAELDRPVPVPTGELGALITWLRSKSLAGDGRTSLLFYADDSTTTTRPGEFPPRGGQRLRDLPRGGATGPATAGGGGQCGAGPVAVPARGDDGAGRHCGALLRLLAVVVERQRQFRALAQSPADRDQRADRAVASTLGEPARAGGRVPPGLVSG